jgi:hypothetical protein
MATSRARSTARSRKRFATLAHAIASTRKPTAIKARHAGSLNRPRNEQPAGERPRPDDVECVGGEVSAVLPFPDLTVVSNGSGDVDEGGDGGKALRRGGEVGQLRIGKAPRPARTQEELRTF